MIRTYSTPLGICYNGDSTSLESSELWPQLNGAVDLLFTSPPFALSRKKEYGNFSGADYVSWFADLAPVFTKTLKPEGSLVIEMGNAWVKGYPIMATEPLRALLKFIDRGELYLCQQFIWNNPARLPSPAQWVNVERIRVKDSFTHIWWMSKSPRPKADNRKILKQYSEAMQKLLDRGTYNSGTRPSEHQIGQTSFLTNNEGAIPSNVFSISNTRSSSNYLTYCKQNGYKKHPARMPEQIVDFFIEFLTDPGDLVFDPFAGSNTTGAVAEAQQRRWIAIDQNLDYLLGSRGRFDDLFPGCANEG